MTTTANDIIIEAFYLTNEYSPDEMPSGSEILQGLKSLNRLKDYLSGVPPFISYVNTFSFNLISGKDTYTFGKSGLMDFNTPRIMEIMDIYILHQGIQYPLNVVTHDVAYHLARALSTQTRPSNVFLQNHPQFSELKFIYNPDLSYSVVLRAKFFIQDFELQGNTDFLPPHYIRYLVYRLCKELCQLFETNTWNDSKERELQNMEKDITSISDADFSLIQSEVMNKRYMGYGKIYITAP